MDAWSAANHIFGWPVPNTRPIPKNTNSVERGVT